MGLMIWVTASRLQELKQEQRLEPWQSSAYCLVSSLSYTAQAHLPRVSKYYAVLFSRIEQLYILVFLCMKSDLIQSSTKTRDDYLKIISLSSLFGD